MCRGVPTLPPPFPPLSSPHSQSEVSDLRPRAEATIAHLIFIASCLCGERTMVQNLLVVVVVGWGGLGRVVKRDPGGLAMAMALLYGRLANEEAPLLLSQDGHVWIFEVKLNLCCVHI